jgi:hypothetical protein
MWLHLDFARSMSKVCSVIILIFFLGISGFFFYRYISIFMDPELFCPLIFIHLLLLRPCDRKLDRPQAEMRLSHVQKPNRQVGILRRLAHMFKYDGGVGAMKPSWTLGRGRRF